MISCKALLQQPKLSYKRYIEKNPQEGPVCFQLFGSIPKEAAEATKIVTDYGADLIDLNCGCPVRKVRAQGAGSKLLENPSQLYKMICALKQNTHLPVSVKIRVDGYNKNHENNNAKVACAINEAGADFLVVHGRHWTDGYNVPCNYEQIQFFVDAMKIPVIGNGDISCVNSLKKMFNIGCAGAMIGRAGIGQPWFIAKLVAELNNEPFTTPSPKEISKTFLEQIELLIKLLGNEKFAVIHARKLASCYARGLSQRAEFSQAVNSCDNLADLKKICALYLV
jgi:tRNA-dihydrouridine synthase B